MNLQDIYGAIFKNAFEKLHAATLLYTNQIYNSSYFLSVIAEEEISKIIIVTIAAKTEKLDELEIRQSDYYNHKVKQRIVTSYNTLEQPKRNLEQKKQSSLYVGIKKGGKAIIPDIGQQKSYAELQNAVDAVIDFAFTKVDINLLDKNIQSMIEGFKIFIDNNCPTLRKELKERHDNDRYENFGNRNLKIALSNPNSLITLFKIIHGENNYKDHLEKIKSKDFKSILKHIGLDK